VNLQTVQSVLALTMSVAMGLSLAASPVIGTVLSKGAFRMNHATVLGNATLTEGALIETSTPASVRLKSGDQLTLGQDSRGQIFGDRLVLEKGMSRLDKSTGIHLVALGLTVLPDRGDSKATVTLDGLRRVRVASSTGALRVLNSGGQLIANLPAGSAVAFEPQPGSGSVARVTGCLRQKSGHYLVTDAITNVTVEIAGAGIPEQLGNVVEVTGAMDVTATPSNDASQLIRAREVRRVTRGCDGGATPAAAKTGGRGGIFNAAGATVAVIGGVAAAAVIGGLAASDALPGQGASPSSR
jgi:hypothetical protein